jgi:Spy/CpxP family protein refolding chaperone
MDLFTQRKLLIQLVILLTALNLVLIGTFLWKDFIRKPRPDEQVKEHRDISKILEKELKLTRGQADQIKNLRSVSFEKERAISETIRKERDSINAIMFGNTPDEMLVKSLARRVAENDYQMELLRFEQSREFKSICTPEQLQKFEGLVLEIRDYFRQDNKPVRN